MAANVLHSPYLYVDGLIGSLARLINFGIALYLTVILGVLDGTPGPNRYGPSPKAPL